MINREYYDKQIILLKIW